MVGWGFGRVLSFCILFSLNSTSIFASKVDCAVALTGHQAFEAAWTKDFSRYPDVDQTSRYLGKKLLQKGGLQDDVRDYLEKGGDPLRMGDRTLVKAFESAFRRLIDNSHVSDEHKLKLHESLTLAVADLSSTPAIARLASGGGDGGHHGGNKGGGGGGGGGDSGGGAPTPGETVSPEEDPALAEDIHRFIKKAGIKRCVSRTTILFAVSNVLNTVGALQAKWAQYAGPGVGVEGFLNQETWDRAWQDDEFRHNVIWNVMLMIALGSFSCMASQNLGKNLMAVVAATSSMAGQWLATGKISIVTTIHDTIFVRFISINKSQFVFRMAESYGRRRLPYQYIVEGSMQAVSETFGAMAYPRTLTLVKSIWKD